MLVSVGAATQNQQFDVSQAYVKQLTSAFADVPSFSYYSDQTVWIIFSGPVITMNPLCTPMANPRVIVEISQLGTVCHIEGHFQRLRTFSVLVDGNQEELLTTIASLRPSSNCVLCGGLPDSLTVNVSFESKSLRNWNPTLNRFDHKECLMWYKPVGEITPARCPKCSRLMYHLQYRIKRKKSISPSKTNKSR